MATHPLASSPAVEIERDIHASQQADSSIRRDALQRDWIIKIELTRTSLPSVCRPKLVVIDRPGSGKDVRDVMQLVHTMKFPPKQKVQPTIVSVTEKPSDTTELSDEEDDSAIESEVGSSDDEDNNTYSVEVDEDGWPTVASSQAVESRQEEATESQESTSDELEFDPNARFFPVNLRQGEQHTFVHSKLAGLAGWNDDFAKVVVGYQKIEFVIPTFLLTDNLEFFRAVFETERWSEGIENTVTLPEESPVDFVLLLRFLVHPNAKDFNEVHTITLDYTENQDALDQDTCYPFWYGSNPIRPNEESEEDITIKPWILRVVAMAERLSFSGPVSRLTEVLDATLEPSSADRVTPALMDWLFDNSAKESFLRTYVYNRLLQSLISGDVNPVIYKDYAEDDPELMTLLLRGSFEHPFFGLNICFDDFFTTRFKSSANGDTVSARASLANENFELAWRIFLAFHRSIHDKTPAYVETVHVWSEDSGWTGCSGMCIGCWNRDLGGHREEIACVLLPE